MDLDAQKMKTLKRLSAERDRLREAIATAKPQVGTVANAELVVRGLERELSDTETELAPLEQESFDNAQRFRNGERMPVQDTVLSRGQSLRSVIGTTTEAPLSAIVRGQALGDWRGVKPQERALLSTSAPAAIPGYQSGGIIDLAREQSVIFRAGAQLMPLASPSAKVARMTSEPSVQWAPESAERSLDEGAFTFDAGELTAYTAWLYTTLSIEAVEDCIDLDATIARAFAQQLSLTFDQGALAGDGSDKPLGLSNMGAAEDRIIEVNGVGAIADHTQFVQAVGRVKANHHEPTSVIMTPGLWTQLACLQDQDDNPLGVPRAYAALDEYVSSFLPSDGGISGTEHTAIVGDLSALTIGVRTDLTIEASRLGAGFRKGAVEVRGYVRWGCYLTRPDAIARMGGITGVPDVDDESPGESS